MCESCHGTCGNAELAEINRRLQKIEKDYRAGKLDGKSPFSVTTSYSGGESRTVEGDTDELEGLACHERRTLARAGLAPDPGACDAGALERAALKRKLAGPYAAEHAAREAARRPAGKTATRRKLSGKTAEDFIEVAWEEIAGRTKMTVEQKQEVLDVTIAAASGQDSYESAARAAISAVICLVQEKWGKA
jgi:hypothetical protein